MSRLLLLSILPALVSAGPHGGHGRDGSAVHFPDDDLITLLLELVVTIRFMLFARTMTFATLLTMLVCEKN